METRRMFHDEIDELCVAVTQLFDMVISAIDRSTAAFLSSDNERVLEVIRYDEDVDAWMSSIEVRVCELLARQAPMASDLRTLLTILRVIHDLERSGDHAVNIAKAGRRIASGTITADVILLVEQMRDQAKRQLAHAIDAFRNSDVNAAHELASMDDATDELQHRLVAWIVGQRDGGSDFLQSAVQLTLVGRYYERIADHAVNIGERVQFMVEGFHSHE